jgi:hypothetical protein
MSMPRRRPSAFLLSSLLAFQAIAMPLGACAQDHDAAHGAGAGAHAALSSGGGHEGGMDGHHAMASGEHGDAVDPAPAHAHGPAHGDAPRTDCTVLSGCGTAVGTVIQVVAFVVAVPERVDMVGVAPGEPLAVDLGISTPPPKI